MDVEEDKGELVEDGVPRAVFVGNADCVVVRVRVAEFVGNKAIAASVRGLPSKKDCSKIVSSKKGPYPNGS